MILYNCYLNFRINNKRQDYTKMSKVLNLRIKSLNTLPTQYIILYYSIVIIIFFALIFIYLVSIHYTKQYVINCFNNISISNLVKMRTLVLNT